MKIIFNFLFAFFLILNVNAQWKLVYQTPTSEIVTVVSSPDDNTLWFITNFDRVYKTTNGGVNWSVIVHPVFIPSGMFAMNKDTAFKTAAQSVYRTVNGGENWTRVFFNASTTSPPDIWMKNNSEGVVSFAGQLYKTTDGGAAWSSTLITQPPFTVMNSNGKGILYGRENDLWACLTSHGIAYSPDFGNSWSLASNSGVTISSPVRIYFGSTAFGVLVIPSNPFIYITTNGAASWRMTDNSLGFNEDAVINGPHCWYIPNPADHFYVKYSQDSGATWAQQLFDPSGFNALEKSRTGNVLWAGTQTGMIYKYIDNITNISESNPSSNGFRLEQNFPNPFNPKTIIRYELRKTNLVSIKIFNLLGNEVAEIVNEMKNAGEYKAEFDGTNLPSGIYFCELKSGNFSGWRKMILLK